MRVLRRVRFPWCRPLHIKVVEWGERKTFQTRNLENSPNVERRISSEVFLFNFPKIPYFLNILFSCDQAGVYQM